MRQVRPIAIYLPQYHPIPENDKAWGEGFTEWTNVKKAKPLFKGHYQPHIPHENVGYYDLRDPNVLVRQTEMAKKYGIYGFAFYHYWFNGKRLLDTPLHNMLSLGKPQFPFCYIWANENWTRKWDGGDNQVIISQNYSIEDDREHIKFLCKNVFNSQSYLKINGKHLFIIYKPFLLPKPTETAELWRAEASKFGIELYLCHMVFGYSLNRNLPFRGFDAVVDFEPFSIRRQNIFDVIKSNNRLNLKLYEKLVIQLMRWLKVKRKIFRNQYIRIDFEWMLDNFESLQNYPVKIFPSIMPGWDNTSRRNNDPTLVITNSSPDFFKNLLNKILEDFKPYSDEENFLFINAWNEWAEGNHMEPCQKYDYAYLEALKQVINNYS